METITNKFYVYIFLDPTKPGIYEYGDLKLSHEPFYVGVSNCESYHVREKVHIKYAKIKKDVTNNKYKMNKINKILKTGQEPIIVKILENASKEESFDLEKELITKIGTRHLNTGSLTNIALGGEGGDTFTNNPRKEEIREKHRFNATGERNHMYGRPLEKNPSHIAKLNGTHWNKGRIASDELRSKFSELNKGPNNNRSKKTLLLDKNFDLVDEFDCCIFISDYLNCSTRSIHSTARKNSKKEIPYHTTKDFFIIYKVDWEKKFCDRISEIKDYLKNFKKTKNQFS